MGRGYYVLVTSQGDFTDEGLRELRIHTDHRMMVAVTHIEGAERNRR